MGAPLNKFVPPPLPSSEARLADSQQRDPFAARPALARFGKGWFAKP
ncbi:MAG: hypothetical protein ACT4OG_08560 [Alphaproteobacteria bacterium]